MKGEVSRADSDGQIFNFFEFGSKDDIYQSDTIIKEGTEILESPQSSLGFTLPLLLSSTPSSFWLTA
jgi:hypothetical protein